MANWKRSGVGKWAACAAVAFVALGFSGAALAADRVVMGEDFTATWCGPCKPAGEALNLLEEDYPDTFTFIQFHVSDAYTTSLGNARSAAYGVEYIPNVWFDGVLNVIGASSTAAAYAAYEYRYGIRIGTPTDVDLSLTGEHVGGQTYRISAQVSIDPVGDAKTMWVYMVHILDHYPTSALQNGNCARPPIVSKEIVTLAPGECQIVERDFTFDAISWDRQDDIGVIAWVQVPVAVGEIFNCRKMMWPFRQVGDLNCDGAVNGFDIDPFVKALTDPAGYAATYPDCDINLADCNRDCSVDGFDIDAFVDLLTS